MLKSIPLLSACILLYRTPVTSRSAPEEKTTTVFELTQVDGEPKRSTGSSTVATTVSPPREGKPTAENSRVETHQRSSACLTRGAEGGGRGTSGLPENTKSSRSQGRALRDGDSATTTTTSRTWKPNVYRTLDWFPIPGRQVLLVDPSAVKATAAAVDEETAAARTAERSAETRPSNGVDLRPRHKGAVDDRGKGNSGDAGLGLGREGLPEHHWERRRGPQDKEADEGEEGGKQAESAKPRKPEGRHERAIHGNSERSEIVLSARSMLPCAASLVDLSCSPPPTDTKAGARARARARSLSGSCRARPHTSASRARGGHKADASSGGLPARPPSTPTNFVVSHSQTKPRVGGLGASRRTPEAYHREASCATLSTPGGGLSGPIVTPEKTRRIPASPNERRGERGGGGGSGGRVEVGKPSPHRQRRDGAAISDTPTSKEGGLQIHRLPVRTMATASRATPPVRKETVVAPGPLRERRHPSRGASNSQPQRAAISGWEGDGTSVIGPQERGTISTGMGRAHGRGGAKMLPTTLHSDNSLGECFSVGSTAASSISSYCGWNNTSNSQN